MWFAPIVIFVAGCLSTESIGDPIASEDEGSGERISDGGVKQDAQSDAIRKITDGSANDASDAFISADAGLPESPRLLHPSNDALLQPLSIFLSWQDRFIPDGTVVSHYEGCFTTGSPGEIEGDVCPNPFTTRDHYTTIETPVTGAAYLWKIKTCFDEAGSDCTGFTESGNFSIGDESLLPFAKWNFNDNLNDDGPNGLNGEAPTDTGFSGPTFVQNGDVCDGEIVSGLAEGDSAACFDDSDGTYDYVELSQHIDALSFGSGDPYSVETRFRRNAIGDHIDLLSMINRAGSPANPGLGIELMRGDGSEYGNHIYTGLLDAVPETGDPDGDGVDIYSLEALMLGSWMNAVLIYDGQLRVEDPVSGINVAESPMSLYVGGVFQGGATSDFDFSADDFHFLTLHAYSGCPETCRTSANVLIDSLAIYRRVLSPEEIVNNLCAYEVSSGAREVTLPPACF